MIELNKIEDAKKHIKGITKLTPCLHMGKMSEETGIHVYLKMENLQYTSSFKKRGAANKINSLTEEQKKKGVICASAGNHAQGVASSATALGIKSVIVMPLTAPLAKVNQTKAYGGEVVQFGANFDECFNYAKKLEVELGMTFIHPFDDEKVIAGQGTIGLEVFEQMEGDFDAIVCGIGGGGLLAGVGSAIKQLDPKIQVIGIQAANAPAMKMSFDSGVWTEQLTKPTLADGMNVARPGKMTFEIIKEVADQIITVTEPYIAKAIKKNLVMNKILSEGAGATGIAAMYEDKLSFLKGKKVVFVISGGNIDEEKIMGSICQLPF